MKTFIPRGFILLPSLFLLSLAASVNAQEIGAGSISISAGGNYTSSESELYNVKNKHLRYSVGLSGNYFFADNLCITLGYQHSRRRTVVEFISDDSSYHSQDFAIYNAVGIRIRKYWFFNKNIAFIVQAGYSLAGQKSSNTNIIPANYRYYEHRIAAVPGIVFFPSPKFAIEMGLGSVQFTANRWKPQSSSPKEIRNKQFSAGLTPTLNLGFQYFLVRR